MSFFESLSTDDDFYKEFKGMAMLDSSDTWALIENILKSDIVEKEVFNIAFLSFEEFTQLLKEYRESLSDAGVPGSTMTSRMSNIRNIIRVTFVAAAMLKSYVSHVINGEGEFSVKVFCEKLCQRYPGISNGADLTEHSASLFSVISHLTLHEIRYTMCVMFSGTDFFTSPASTMFHGDWFGGLADHSIAVLEAAMSTYKTYGVKEFSPIWFVLHDLCKCNCYELVDKSKKNPQTGKWETTKSWSTRKDYLSIQHGAESVVRIQDAILRDDSADGFDWMRSHFTKNWQFAIAYHMGMYDIGESDKISYNNAVKSYPEILLMHHADIIASHIWGI